MSAALPFIVGATDDYRMKRNRSYTACPLILLEKHCVSSTAARSIPPVHALA
jgi:hypothetical protein